MVGLSSVGNDPLWQDNGSVHQFKTYWNTYSFGTLSESALLRKEILGKLLPALKIAKVAHIEDDFLVVKGTLRTYKIHLGSTRVLMSPNDQYLGIGPTKTRTKTKNLYLPFEGDEGLSVIIGKALFLAADDKIKDEAILSQIKQ